MNIKIFIIYTALLLVLGLSPISAAGNQYGTYINKNFNYTIVVPKSWPKEESAIAEKHTMFAKLNANTGIKIRSFRSSDENIEKITHSETWDLKKIDPRMNKIIETEKIQIQKNITGKLLIFEYRAKKSNLLQRTLIAVNSGIIYIVECKAPVTTFYKYEDIFTTALASFTYIESSFTPNASSAIEEPLEEDVIEDDLKEDEQL